MLTFNQPTIQDLASKEWIITNGLGGYASSTICGMNTRRYHGLLVASYNPPTDRRVLVSKVEEQISNQRDCSIEMSTNQYGEIYHPKGFQYLKSFERMPFPKMEFEIGIKKLSKSIRMVPESNTTIITYQNTGLKGYQLTLRPIFVSRDYHALMAASDWHDYYYQMDGNTLKVNAHYGAAPVYMAFSKGEFKENRFWIKDVTYAKETYRGLDDKESTYALGTVEQFLAPGEQIELIFSAEEDGIEKAHAWLADQFTVESITHKDPYVQFYEDLKTVAPQFIVKRAATGGFTLIAGYHWFTDWGRDTMIAMRGLVNEIGERDIAASILNTFMEYLDQGMLPNRFPDVGEEPEYNTIDATLWMFVVLYDYYQKFGDATFIKSHFEKLEQVIEHHIKGTRYNIHLTKKGLLYGGEGTAQLTWMDARVDDYVVTPRHGCPVEINALWYNALSISRFFINKLGLTSEWQPEIEAIISKLEQHFVASFYNAEGYLNDVVLPDGTVDASIRPNQIYALNLPFQLLDKDQALSVLKTVEEHLLTPLGLRSLATSDKQFRPVYKGSSWDRDTSYHQGTVWGFLLGEYLMAYLMVHGLDEEHKAYVRDNLSAMKTHFYEHDCIYGISEIFDGLNPQEGRGTIHQAWSIGTLLPILNLINA